MVNPLKYKFEDRFWENGKRNFDLKYACLGTGREKLLEAAVYGMAVFEIEEFSETDLELMRLIKASHGRGK